MFTYASVFVAVVAVVIAGAEWMRDGRNPLGLLALMMMVLMFTALQFFNIRSMKRQWRILEFWRGGVVLASDSGALRLEVPWHAVSWDRRAETLLLRAPLWPVPSYPWAGLRLPMRLFQSAELYLIDQVRAAGATADPQSPAPSGRVTVWHQEAGTIRAWWRRRFGLREDVLVFDEDGVRRWDAVHGIVHFSAWDHVGTRLGEKALELEMPMLSSGGHVRKGRWRLQLTSPALQKPGTLDWIQGQASTNGQGAESRRRPV